MKRRELLLFTIPLAVLGTGAVFFERGPDPVIFPHQEIPIIFTHDYHVRAPDEAKGTTGEGLSCDFCHENVGDSLNAHDRDIPGHGTCETCHDEWIGDEDTPAPRAMCAKCHSDLRGASTATTASRMNIPPPNVRFPHQLHIAADVKCVDCHKNVPRKGVATRDDYPTMDRCVGCHLERGASTECATCHFTTPDGRVQKTYPQGELKPNRYHSFAIHDADFLRDHAVPAQRDEAYCKTCHTESDCMSCHDGIGWDARYHPSDWIAVHSVKARKDDHRCESCHRMQDFCLNCHVRSGVATVGTFADPFQRRTIRLGGDGFTATGPHPMAANGWLDPASQNFHGFHAQRNIRACVACHQEQYCLTCHSSAQLGGGRGGNPHGPNPERLRGSTASKRNARACLKCHHPNDPTWR